MYPYSLDFCIIQVIGKKEKKTFFDRGSRLALTSAFLSARSTRHGEKLIQGQMHQLVMHVKSL